MGNACEICCPCQGFSVQLYAAREERELVVYAEPARCFNNCVMCVFPLSIPVVCLFGTIDKYTFKGDGTVQVEKMNACGTTPSALFGVTHTTTAGRSDIFLHASDNTVLGKIECGDASEKAKGRVSDMINKFYEELRRMLKSDGERERPGEPNQGEVKLPDGPNGSLSLSMTFPPEGHPSPSLAVTNSPASPTHKVMRLEHRLAEAMKLLSTQQSEIDSLKGRLDILEHRAVAQAYDEKRAQPGSDENENLLVPGEVVSISNEGKRGNKTTPNKDRAASADGRDVREVRDGRSPGEKIEIVVSQVQSPAKSAS